MAVAVKKQVKKIIDNLPEESTIDDIMHALYIRAKMEQGEREIDAGHGIPHEEVKKKLMKKWAK